MGRAGSEGQGVVIFMLRMGCGVQETMGTEESLGLGQAQCCRQVQTGSQQDALVGQRIQTGPESEQRRGISPAPTQQDLAIPFCRAPSGCGWSAGPHPCFPTNFCQEPGHPAAGVGGSAPALSSLLLFLSSLLFVSSILNRNINF